MKEQQDLGSIGVSFGQGEDVEIVVTDIEILACPPWSAKPSQNKLTPPDTPPTVPRVFFLKLRPRLEHTLMPSSEKQGGTAELSSSASLNSVGNFSTADIGMSPR